MTAKVVRTGVIGFGMGGRVFHAPLIASVEGMELAAVVERTSNKAAERYPGITTYRSVQAMLDDASIDLFVVTTPSGTHFELARQILAAGRNLVVDKPVCTTSAQVAELIELAAAKKALLIPFQNRRWDGDFQTVARLIEERALGRLVSFESRLDRWKPDLPAGRMWKESVTAGGGTLLDLGPHLIDQALMLFGKPESVSAEVWREREPEGANDAFNVRLRYPGLVVTLGANSLSLPAGPRFHLRGTKGGYWKSGVDPQEAALGKIAHIEDPRWGEEPVAAWGTLHIGIDGGTVSRPVETERGDYRRYYAAVRDAVLGKVPAPVEAVDAWRVSRVLEWAAESAERRCEVICDWSGEPA